MSDNNSLEHQWYQNAVFYAVIVEVFKDGNSDGIGDFVGLTMKLPYLKNLGIDCIWLLPFHPSGGRDNGYDVTDYYNIDPRLGTLGEFKTFVKEAERFGIKVIIDLVVHHTSDQHPWFEEASKNPNSKYRNYYVWTDKIPDGIQMESAFPSIEAGVWQFNGESKLFYHHSFYHFQPDLNIANPKVQHEIEKIMDFWMEFGIAGFRIDAATFMFERKGLPGTEVPDADLVMDRWNKHIKEKNPDAILLGEADVTSDKVPLFFGNGKRMDLMYNFLLNRYIFLSFADKKTKPLYDFMKKLPTPPSGAQWVDFLRNHDELNIEQLSKREQKRVFGTFAPTDGMIVYNRGIRRRLAPMFEGNLNRLKMAYSLLFSLPGAQMILYGDEIGMGDDLRLPERVSVRTPMQWNDSINANFSDSHPSTLIRGIISEGDYRYQKVNVEKQLKNDSSLLNHIKQLIKTVKKHKEIGYGESALINSHHESIFIISYVWEGHTTIMITNFSKNEAKVTIPEIEKLEMKEFFSNKKYSKIRKNGNLTLSGYGFRWFESK